MSTDLFGGVNKVILVGNLARDPEIRTMNNGNKVANLSLVTNQSWKDKNSGERKDKPEFHRVTVWNDGLVGLIEKYLSKGSKIFAEGQLETRKWTDQEGNDRYSTEVVLNQIGGGMSFLDRGNKSENKKPSDDNGYSNKTPAYDMDDEIPFG